MAPPGDTKMVEEEVQLDIREETTWSLTCGSIVPLGPLGPLGAWNLDHLHQVVDVLVNSRNVLRVPLVLHRLHTLRADDCVQNNERQDAADYPRPEATYSMLNREARLAPDNQGVKTGWGCGWGGGI